LADLWRERGREKKKALRSWPLFFFFKKKKKEDKKEAPTLSGAPRHRLYPSVHPGPGRGGLVDLWRERGREEEEKKRLEILASLFF
jgi:hypothetical protein